MALVEDSQGASRASGGYKQSTRVEECWRMLSKRFTNAVPFLALRRTQIRARWHTEDPLLPPQPSSAGVKRFAPGARAA